MATTLKRKITLTYNGDVGGISPGFRQEVSAADSSASPAVIQLVTLAAGDNTITAPAVVGFTPKACTIMKPSGNATAIMLKGDAGDTGIRLHDTDPDSVSLHSSQTTFILNAGAQIDGVRLFWT